MENDSEVKYAGFGIRILAFLIDNTVFGSIIYGLDKSGIITNKYVMMALVLLILLTYFSYAISKWRATLGKKILGLEVLDLKLKPLSLKRSTQRLIFSILTYMILFSPELIIYLFGENMTLWLISIIFMFIPVVMMLKSKRKQILHDYLAKTIVININREDSFVKEENNCNDINNRMDAKVQNKLEEKEQSKIGLFLKILAIPFVLYMIFFIYAAIVLILGPYNGN